MTNFDRLARYFSDFESPEHFITWNYLYMISSCLGRKVWFQTGAPIFPNIYVVIVGPPAVGKSMAARTLGNVISSLVTIDDKNQPKELVKIVPECVTLERLYEVIEKSVDSFRLDNKPKIHSSVSFLLADEMALLFKKSDKMQDLVMFLNAGYDCTEKFRYETKKNGTNIINNMCINFLGCCTPNWITQNVSSSIIDDGWASRVFFIFGDERRKLTTFYKFDADQNKCLDDIRKHCRQVAMLTGEVSFSPEALAYFDNWYQKRQFKERINRDQKLDSYYARKKLHIIKLSMLVHFAEKTNMIVDLDDLKLAFAIAAEAEKDMHKALASVNANPAARMAEEILKSVKGHGALSRVEIVDKHFNNAPGGLTTIDDALAYLVLTGRLAMIAGPKYVIPDNVVKPDFINADQQSGTSLDSPGPVAASAL